MSVSFNKRICAALLHREITHSAFRLYVALATVVPARKQNDFAEIYVDKLKEAVPGVRGKPLGEGPLRENLKELQRLGLIEMAGRQWSRHHIHVKLTDWPMGGDGPDELRNLLVVPEAQAWRPEVWR